MKSCEKNVMTVQKMEQYLLSEIIWPEISIANELSQYKSFVSSSDRGDYIPISDHL